MPKMFQYGKSASNQGAGIMSHMTAGINEYLPSNTINDALMSDEIDVYPYREECVLFNANAQITGKNVSNTKTRGYVRACIHSDESTLDTEVFYLMTSKITGWSLIKHIYHISTNTTSFGEDAMTMASVPADPTLVDSSSAVFKVETDTYYVFSNTHEKRIHFIKHTSAADSYAYIDVPAYPKKLVAHASRIFFIDTSNKIWWCRAGDLYSWYSMEYDADALVTTRNCVNEAFTVAAQPTTTRQVTATVTKVDVLDTLGILTVVGTSGLGAAQTEALTLIEGRVQGSMAFKTITSATQSGWTIGGTTADTIVVGVAPVGLGFVTDDAGFWTLEQELFLHDICILGNCMYIFTNHNIYAFNGYSPDTFSLSKIISDIGIDRMEKPNGYHKLTTGRNVAYFIYDGFVYEFDGNSQPHIMSRPVVVNNQSSNGIMGGIDFTGESWVVQSIADALCLYDYTGDTAYYYFYRFETKTWWKRSGFTSSDITNVPMLGVQYLVVAAGGGSLHTPNLGSGGGGGGGVVYGTLESADTLIYYITVGEGVVYGNGENSSFGDGIVAIGGGVGGWDSGYLPESANGGNGGSGGGGSWTDIGAGIGGSGVIGQGQNGGDGGTGNIHNMVRVGGGGGGAGGAGENAVDSYGAGIAGNGGVGIENSISGAETYYGGGGGGGSWHTLASDSEVAQGGLGGGGNGGHSGADAFSAGINGTANTGGGAGGDSDSESHMGTGGSGIVIIRYPTPSVSRATGGAVSIVGNYTVHTFTESGIFEVTEVLTPGFSAIEKIAYIPAFNRQEWFNFISLLSDTQDYVYANEQGCTQGIKTPFFATKAFNTNPSETGTLTEIILAIKGTAAETANIKVQYSLTVDADDFADIRSYTGYAFNGDLEVISIPVPISQIANAHHYRIRVEVGNCSDTEGVYLYNIERRFRVKGRSR